MNAKERGNILIVDDDPDIVEWLKFVLEGHGFKTFAAADAFSALHLCKERRPDLMILDLHLGDYRIQGTEVLWGIKNDPSLASTVVLIFTGCRDETIKKYCLDDIGADGYLVKGEAHRINLPDTLSAWLRLIRLHEAKNELISGPVHFDLKWGTASVDKRPIPLTPREYNTLLYLVRKSPDVTPWQTLARRVWNAKPQGPYLYESPELMEACVAHLRFKLGREAGRHLIKIPNAGVAWTGKGYLAD